MNLYLVENKEFNVFRQCIDSMVVAALDENSARLFRPENPMTQGENHWPIELRFISVEKIGVCDPDRPAGLILMSWND